MKICHLLWGLKYGGIETMVINIANAQAAEGHDVHLMIVNDMIDPPLLDRIAPGVTFHNAGRRVGSKNPLPLLRLNLMFLRIRPDIVHFHHVRLHRYVLPALRPHWCTTHHTNVIPAEDKDLILTIPHLFAISSGAATQIGAGTVVVNGIEVSDYRTKSEYYQGGRKFRIVQIGRLEHQTKGQDILIKAVAKLKNRGVDVAVDLVGAGKSEKQLMSLIHDLGVKDQIRLLGKRSPEWIADHLADYDLLVQPSRIEGFGLTVVEAMVVGVPVIVSELETLMEVIGNGAYGECFDNEDDLAEKIAQMIANYDCSKIEMARERAKKLYNVKITALEYLARYQSMLGV